MVMECSVGLVLLVAEGGVWVGWLGVCRMEMRPDALVAALGNSLLQPRRQNSRRWEDKNLLSKNNIKITFDVCYVNFYLGIRVLLFLLAASMFNSKRLQKLLLYDFYSCKMKIKLYSVFRKDESKCDYELSVKKN